MSFFQDARTYQIATLTGLLTYGLFGLDLGIRAGVAATMVAVALASQLIGTQLVGLPRFDPKSALISSMSLCLLLRTQSVGLAAVAAAVAVSSKFLLRVDDRHVFNPTNFALVTLMFVTDAVWVSPGQWGTGAFFTFLFAALGGLVVHRASRSDVTYALLLFYATIVFARALWLGDPWALPIHHLENGAFLLFAFFMISDPKTTPDSRAGRIVFAALVALGAGFVHFVLFRQNGFLWSLVLAAPTVPLLNRLLPGSRFEWHPRATPVGGNLPERSFA